MYNLNLERRKHDRRFSQTKGANKNLNSERRCSERRCDTRPLDEFPYLPKVISY